MSRVIRIIKLATEKGMIGMETIIKKGVSIIQMPPQEKRKNKKTGVLGTWIDRGKIKAEIYYNGKKYHLGTHEKIKDAKKMRETAETKVKDGTFPEWYASIFPPKINKYGVPGLSYRKDGNKYSLRIGYNGIKYDFKVFEKVEDAALVRSEADKHIADGTFVEWFSEYTSNKRG